jgi:hypothetical protein
LPPVLFAVEGPTEVFSALTPLGEFVPGVLASFSVTNENRNDWRVHSPSRIAQSTLLAQFAKDIQQVICFVHLEGTLKCRALTLLSLLEFFRGL